ncbi:MAG: murein L,D-transpeptidase catalytic domain family protein [Flavobacteriales bacterium]|nr:murein L,D-transpeptidase catalytic domain family protein [Flavobacteriales bacterium]MBK7941846.1 murein L,D-transpeptidase catalytic domain family protein [Flavobacteriales bacterium]MBK8947655.1 murein L,D-transpeptidase catalytic domain family protein [Flavobacteriales bacterium]MBK9700389.1 murein L,D-transpeptidase catalytic domain family protein [Flavobacteriales bacterium]
MDEVVELHRSSGLEGLLALDAFRSAYEQACGQAPDARVLAIADMSRPSTEKRLVVIDLITGRTLLHTYVAHGQGTGELMAEVFGNEEGSHRTSLGLYRVGTEIVSPKHGQALLLHGLDKGVNDRALEREIIMHGADYVSEAFIAEHGRLGRSWGCPAVPRNTMSDLVRLLADGGLLYVHHPMAGALAAAR